MDLNEAMAKEIARQLGLKENAGFNPADIRKLEGKSDAELEHEILKLRVDVFVVEQNCPYPEIDGRDQDAWHVSLREGERLLAYLRVLPRGEGEAAIGRVLAVERRRGFGTKVVEEGIRVAREKLGALAKSDEDVLSYIAFPNLAEAFLEKRKAKEENICTYSITEI